MIESRRKLFAEDCRQFGLRGWRYATARCVSQVGLDSRLYSDPWLLGSLGNWALARGIRRGEGQFDANAGAMRALVTQLRERSAAAAQGGSDSARERHRAR